MRALSILAMATPFTALAGYNVMGVAKASLEATVRHLAGNLGPEGIRVNAVRPGSTQRYVVVAARVA